jgi:hypothetical protein
MAPNTIDLPMADASSGQVSLSPDQVEWGGQNVAATEMRIARVFVSHRRLLSVSYEAHHMQHQPGPEDTKALIAEIEDYLRKFRLSSLHLKREPNGSQSETTFYGYMVENRPGVVAFLARYPFLVSLLIDTRSYIERHFPGSQISLEVFSDTEGAEDSAPIEYLAVDIPTTEDPREALRKLRAVDREWWLRVVPYTRGLISLHLEYR